MTWWMWLLWYPFPGFLVVVPTLCLITAAGWAIELLHGWMTSGCFTRKQKRGSDLWRSPFHAEPHTHRMVVSCARGAGCDRGRKISDTASRVMPSTCETGGPPNLRSRPQITR